MDTGSAFFDSLGAPHSLETSDEPLTWVKDITTEARDHPVLETVPELKVVFTQEIGKNVRHLVLQEVPEVSPSVAIESLPLDEETLRKLLDSGSLRAAFCLTTKILLNEVTLTKLNIWLTRLNLYIRFGAYTESKCELDQFNQLEDLPIQLGINSQHGGVPFSLLLAVAHLNLLCGNKHKAQTKLTKLLQQCSDNIAHFKQHGKESFVCLWKERELKALAMLANSGAEQADFKYTISTMMRIRARQTSPSDLIRTESYIAKLFLQFGDIEMAEKHFKEAARFSQGLSGRLQVLTNQGLLAIANNDFQSAYNAYEQASQLQPQNPLYSSNMAACALYMCRSSEGVKLIEDSLSSDPSATINECIVGNICALYRLQSTVGEMKKATVKQMVAKYAPETFNTLVLETEG